MPFPHDVLAPLIDRIHSAAARRTPLRIRGGGSKDFYGQAQASEVLDTRSLSGVIDYAPSELVVTVGAGTPLHTLEALLASQGQCLPFEPPHFAWSARSQLEGTPADTSTDTPAGASTNTSVHTPQATVGGMVASGLAGPARASVGGVRDYVLGVELINGRGEPLRFGGQVMKNVAGYDVSRLMVGSMGTLGLVTQVSLKVLPLPPAEATLVCALPQAQALQQLHRWGGQPLPLNASCWVHDPGADAGRGRDLLFVRLRGAAAAVQAATQRMLAEVPGAWCMDTVQAQAQAQSDWALCRDQQLPFFTPPAPHAGAPGLVLWRLSVPQTAPALDLPWPQLIEWHGALRWLWAPAQAGAQLQAAVQAVGGSAMIFVAPHADPASARALFDAPLHAPSAAQAQIQQRLQHAFDPHGVFDAARRTV